MDNSFKVVYREYMRLLIKIKKFVEVPTKTESMYNDLNEEITDLSKRASSLLDDYERTTDKAKAANEIKNGVAVLRNILQNAKRLGTLQKIDYVNKNSRLGLEHMRDIFMAGYNSYGKLGKTIAKSHMEEATNNFLYDESMNPITRAYPVYKLYFIEKDSDEWIFYDDLYGYDNVIQFEAHASRKAATDYARIVVTNYKETLTNVFSETRQSEFPTWFDKRESEKPYAIMLKPGCKIAVKAGYTATLGPKDEFFIGEVTNVSGTDILTIEAQGFGATLTNIIAADKQGQLGSMTGNVIGTGYDQMIKLILRLLKLTPMNNLGGTTFYSTDMVELEKILNEKDKKLFEDFVQENIIDPIKSSFLTSLTGFSNKDGLTPDIVRRHSENIRLNEDTQDSSWYMRAFLYLSKMIQGWTLWKDTSWGALNEMVSFIPNHIAMVRPYDLRGTLCVGSIINGYYKYTDKYGIANFSNSAVIQDIQPIVYNPEECLAYLLNKLRTGDKGTRNIIAYYYARTILRAGKQFITTAEYNKAISSSETQRSNWFTITERDFQGPILQTRKAEEQVHSFTEYELANMQRFVKRVEDSYTNIDTDYLNFEIGWSMNKLKLTPAEEEFIHRLTERILNTSYQVYSITSTIDSVTTASLLRNDSNNMSSKVSAAVDKKREELSKKIKKVKMASNNIDYSDKTIEIIQSMGLRELTHEKIQELEDSPIPFSSDFIKWLKKMFSSGYKTQGDFRAYKNRLREVTPSGVPGSSSIFEKLPQLYNVVDAANWIYKIFAGEPSIEEWMTKDNLPVYDIKSRVAAFAAQKTCQMMLNLAYSKSIQHQPISNKYVKMTGVHIISNNIQLMEGFNAINFNYLKKPRVDSDADLFSTANIGSKKFKLHETIDNDKIKIYDTEILKNARPIETFRQNKLLNVCASSIMCNLVRDYYDGTLVIIGDQRIKPHDVIYIYDETRDMYGVIGVESVIHKFTPTEGFITVIKPDLLAYNQIDIGAFDWRITATRVAGWLKTLIIVGAGMLAWKYVKKIGFNVIKRYRGSSTFINSLKSHVRMIENSKTRSVFLYLFRQARDKVRIRNIMRSINSTLDNGATDLRAVSDLMEEIIKGSKTAATEMAAEVSGTIIESLRVTNNPAYIDQMRQVQAKILSWLDNAINYATTNNLNQRLNLLNKIKNSATANNFAKVIDDLMFSSTASLKAGDWFEGFADTFSKKILNAREELATLSHSQTLAFYNKKMTEALFESRALSDFVNTKIRYLTNISTPSKAKRTAERIINTLLERTGIETSRDNLKILARMKTKLRESLNEGLFRLSRGDAVSDTARNVEEMIKHNTSRKLFSIFFRAIRKNQIKPTSSVFKKMMNKLKLRLRTAGDEKFIKQHFERLKMYFMAEELGKMSGFLKEVFKNFTKQAKYIAGAYFMTDLIQDILQFRLSLEGIGESVAMSGLFHKGEPFIANVDGMSKGTMNSASLTDILQRRIKFGTRRLAQNTWFRYRGMIREAIQKRDAVIRTQQESTIPLTDEQRRNIRSSNQNTPNASTAITIQDMRNKKPVGNYIQVPVSKVIDGDTIDVTINGNTKRIRFWGINTPELHNTTGKELQYAKKALEEVKKLILGKNVQIQIGSTGSYGRTLAKVKLTDGTDLGTHLLSIGYARVYMFDGAPVDPYYMSVQENAKAAKRGLWSN